MSFKNYDFIVVGCGLTGSVIAKELALKGNKVAILEKRNHIAGNLYDSVMENISVQYYGPHSFHTNSERVYNYIKKYTKVFEYILRCQVKMLGEFTPSPFNLKTIEQYFDNTTADKIKKAIIEEYGGEKSKTIVELLDSDNEYIRTYADFLYTHDYSLYTAKQWGLAPECIDKSVLKRVPVLFNYDEQYFYDKYQFMPEHGFTEFIKNIINSPNITVFLNTDFFDNFKIYENKVFCDGSEFKGEVIYTGPLDRLLNYKYGHLPYRSLRFEYKVLNLRQFQPAPVVAYPEEKGFTRITEYTQMPPQDVGNKTIIAYEYPLPESNNNEPYYPILTEESKSLCEKYTKLAGQIKNLYLAGRLAKFKYYNMDQAIEEALEFCDAYFGGVKS